MSISSRRLDVKSPETMQKTPKFLSTTTELNNFLPNFGTPFSPFHKILLVLMCIYRALACLLACV